MAQYLGEIPLVTQPFGALQETLLTFRSSAFQALRAQQRLAAVNQALYACIQKEKTPCFLLPAVVDYIGQVQGLGVLDTYTFAHFELWLNQFSGLSAEENYEVRAKIVGKRLPRSAYQGLFPIGMGKVYPGSHFVTAHGSPDVDTTVASFWGWVDAFGARVSEGLHVWNVPGGVPQGQVEIDLLFPQMLGSHLLSATVKTRTTLSLSGMDLMTQKGLARATGQTSILEIDHAGDETAVILVDAEGHYLGDWRSWDVEGVRQVISLFNHSLRWFSHRVQMELLELLSKEKVTAHDVSAFLERVLHCQLGSSGPALEFTTKQREMVGHYLQHVLHIKKGLSCTFHEFAHEISGFQPFIDLLSALQNGLSALLDQRSKLFDYLQQVMKTLDQAIEKVRLAVERLDIALKIKADVFGQKPHYINYRADVDEIRAKMVHTPYLSVIATDKEGHLTPLGVIHASDLSKSVLGTVTLRDFCNKEETKIPTYLEVISVIDHHKSQLQTTSAAMVLISDAQSSNVLCAEMAFALNDRFGTAGMEHKQIDTQVEALKKDSQSLQNKRRLARLLQKQCVAQSSSDCFVDPTRERMEYLHFLYGILDDTDLLTKVSVRDLECVVQLLNRLKSLAAKQEVETLSLHDLVHDETFLLKARLRILQNPDLYSLYKQVYLAKERAVEKNLVQAATATGSLFFADTKVQNGCARVGQSKLFPSNYPLFTQHALQLQHRWQSASQEFSVAHADVDLHLYMISTIAGAEEVFAGSEEAYAHQDQLWIWIPFTEASIEHLKEFLNAFSSASQMGKTQFTADFYGERAADYAEVFSESFHTLASQRTHKGKGPSLAVLNYPAGFVNSRKAMISPYLPK